MLTRFARKPFFGGLFVAVLVEVVTFVLRHALRGLIG